MDHILASYAAQAIAQYPHDEARIRRACTIIERGEIELQPDNLALVGIHGWRVNGHCQCPDAALGQAIDGRCKHRWAKTLYKKWLHGLGTEAAQSRQRLIRREWESRYGCQPPSDEVLLAEPWIEEYFRIIRVEK